MPKLIVVIPVYNEEACIEEVILEWSNYLKNAFNDDAAILALNDGSKDNSKDILENLKSNIDNLRVINKENSGHGPTIIEGYKEAINLGAEWIFQTDSDNQTEPKDLSLLWEKKDESDFIIGHRQNRDDPLVRLLVTKFLKLLILLVFGTAIKDANIPFRLMKASLLRKFLKIIDDKTFAPNILLTIAAKKSRLNLYNIPISHRRRETGEVSISHLKLIKVCCKSTYQLVLFRKRLASFKLG